MLKSVYSRIFYFCIIALMFASAVTGIAVMICANRHYEQETRDEIEDSAQVILATIRNHCTNVDVLPAEQIQSDLQNYTMTYNIDCYLFDDAGKCVVRSDFGVTEMHLNETLRRKADDAPYCQFGANENTLPQSTARYVEYLDIGSTRYYLMLLYPLVKLDDFSQHLMVVLVIAVLLIGLIASPLFYLNTYQLLKPVTDITHAAESYAKGDFSVRLEPHGDGELDYLAATLNRMADFIDRNERSRKSFISNVSHELKTPMTTIGGFVDGILDGAIPPERSKEYLQVVSSEVQRMTRLIHSMLNISKFEEGTLAPDFKRLDVTSLIIQTLLLFEQKAEAKKLSVEGLDDAAPTYIEADRDLMQQVFYNLTENAIKFVNEGGTLSLAIATDENRAEIHLRNTGEGLSESEMSHIFERFYKTDASRGKDTTGVGLGLSIVSRIINLHNGTVTVKSVPEEYTEFVLSLPLTQPEAARKTDENDAPVRSDAEKRRKKRSKKGQTHESDTPKS